MVRPGTARPGLTLAVLALAASGCSGTGQTTGDGTMVRLDPVGKPGISGTVVISPGGQETAFTMTLTASSEVERGRELDVRLRAGTCSAPGRIIRDIEDVRPNGRPEREDEDIRFEELRRSNHIIEVTVDDSDQVVACGNIPRG